MLATLSSSESEAVSILVPPDGSGFHDDHPRFSILNLLTTIFPIIRLSNYPLRILLHHSSSW
jgi:hypothetical protein